MQYEDGQFENYLREFEPRRPKPLPIAFATRFNRRRLAAAAAVLIALGTASWLVLQGHPPRVAVREAKYPPKASFSVRPSVLRLTRMAVEDPLKLDAELAEESHRILLNFRSKESTLRVLAKE